MTATQKNAKKKVKVHQNPTVQKQPPSLFGQHGLELSLDESMDG